MRRRLWHAFWVGTLLLTGCSPQSHLSLGPTPPAASDRHITSWTLATSGDDLELPAMQPSLAGAIGGPVGELDADDIASASQNRLSPDSFRRTIEAELASWNRRHAKTVRFTVGEVRWSAKRPGKLYFEGKRTSFSWRWPNDLHSTTIFGYYDPKDNDAVLVDCPEAAPP